MKLTELQMQENIHKLLISQYCDMLGMPIAGIHDITRQEHSYNGITCLETIITLDNGQKFKVSVDEFDI